jgi:hypothetical protein
LIGRMSLCRLIGGSRVVGMIGGSGVERDSINTAHFYVLFLPPHHTKFFVCCPKPVIP